MPEHPKAPSSAWGSSLCSGVKNLNLCPFLEPCSLWVLETSERCLELPGSLTLVCECLKWFLSTYSLSVAQLKYHFCPQVNCGRVFPGQCHSDPWLTWMRALHCLLPAAGYFPCEMPIYDASRPRQRALCPALVRSNFCWAESINPSIEAPDIPGVGILMTEIIRPT